MKLSAALTILGGYDCSSWTYRPDAKSIVRPTLPGPALEVSATGRAIISDLEFQAPSGSSAFVSSIAAFVKRSDKLSLRRVTLIASKGAQGVNGNAGANGSLSSSTPVAGTLNGSPGTSTEGGKAQACTCSNGGTSKGGRGGDPGGANIDGEAGTSPQAIEDPVGANGAGSTRAACETTSTPGTPGSNAANGIDGNGATDFGVVSDSGWQPQPGKIGGAGPAGQGGGGGGGDGGSGGGGSGACGGCGGHGGEPGAGGGASIALVAFESPVELIECKLVADQGGAGGTGGAGGGPMTGGTRSGLTGGGCRGGNGGNGGKGGTGGGGAGGLSAGIAYRGAKPTVNATFTKGTKGAKGVGGTQGKNDGFEGDPVEIFESK
ncbi:MAG: hypothetical protein JST00_03840 [Deltaproteobacteria bacterium]|nr:hypothetical protein [Deltaproteobacteria bacterium]